MLNLWWREGVGKLEGKRPLGKLWRRYECHIQIDLQEGRWGEGTERIDLAHDRYRWRALVIAVMKLRIP
jgi:hypothetical protein